ncbi:polysaccharide deacetylase family protein [Pleomorphovibrio marinus]|uniref:polysaccharide deacetylase family protein n=1 Tax=Pleomorphovibrio marinus TaxID=2164132 RepID=UPI000E0C3D05|nr:polysaccharide deacetylase family protein [Pleomorphovibrio marinus]
MKLIGFLIFIMGTLTQVALAQDTYAEKLGYPSGTKVVIFHVDDAGMSYESNMGTISSIEKGVATSCSIMMPCPWSASFTKYAIDEPMDAGVHLTLTSEWKDYRWHPVAGKSNVPSLVDKEGALWHSVEQVIQHGDPEDVEKEIRAQIDRARTLGLIPTHLDSHMGTLFYHEPFLEKYIKVGAELGIPVMFPGGNNKLLKSSMLANQIKNLKKEGKYKEGMELPEPELLKKTRAVGDKIWASGLPVLDDLHSISGSWKPEGEPSMEEWGSYKTAQFKEILEEMEPGLAMIIIHSIEHPDTFSRFSGSGESRYADNLSMMDPELKAYIDQEGILLTTWKEVMQRRRKVK